MKTVPQNFEAIRAGLLPMIEKGVYSIVDVYTKAGAKRYDANIKRAIVPEPAIKPTKPTKKGKS